MVNFFEWIKINLHLFTLLSLPPHRGKRECERECKCQRQRKIFASVFLFEERKLSSSTLCKLLRGDPHAECGDSVSAKRWQSHVRRSNSWIQVRTDNGGIRSQQPMRQMCERPRYYIGYSNCFRWISVYLYQFISQCLRKRRQTE